MILFEQHNVPTDEQALCLVRWVAERHPDAQQSATGARSTPPVKAAVYLILGKAATYMGLDLSKPLK